MVPLVHPKQSILVRMNGSQRGIRSPMVLSHILERTMKDKKAAKLIIKRSKENPGWYTEQEVYYAKMIKKRIKATKLRNALKDESGSGIS